MATYRAETKHVSRSSGRSAVAAAAYRVRGSLVDERQGLTHDYSQKQGLSSADIVTPTGVAVDRGALWNAAEAAERAKNSRTAREWIISLPHELDKEARRSLALAFAGELVTRYGVAADVCIHTPDEGGDNRNHHAHILTTTRKIEVGPNGEVRLGGKSVIELSDTDIRKLKRPGIASGADEMKEVREIWEQQVNAALELGGLDVRVSSESLAAQGIERVPQIKLGPVATQMERAAKKVQALKEEEPEKYSNVVVPFSDRAEINREIAADNSELARVTAEIIDLKAERERRNALALEQAKEAEQVAERQQLLAEYINVPLDDLQKMADIQKPRSVDDRIDGRANVSKAINSANKIKDEIETAKGLQAQIKIDVKGWRDTHWLQCWLFKEPRGVAAFRRQFNEQGAIIKKLGPVLKTAFDQIEAQRNQVREECEQDYSDDMARWQRLPVVVAIEQAREREIALKSLSDAPHSTQSLDGLGHNGLQQKVASASSQAELKPRSPRF